MKTLLAALLVLAPSVVQAEVLDRVAAVVNNDAVTLSEVQQRAAPMLARIDEEPEGPQRDADTQDALRRALDDLIGEKLMDAELKDMNVEVTDQEVDLAIQDVRKQNHITDDAAFATALKGQGFTPDTYKAFMRKQLAKVKLLNIKVKSKIKISDEDVKAEYARMAHAQGQDLEIHARHIIVLCPANAPTAEVERTHQKALQIMALAQKPGADFAALAKQYSEGSGASSGGDLGWFARGTLAAPFENAAFALKKGQVSQPVRTQYGWHVIQLLDTRHAAPRPFKDVEEQLRSKLYREKVEKQTTAYIDGLRHEASVEVKIASLRDPKALPEAAPTATAGTGEGTVVSGPGAVPASPKGPENSGRRSPGQPGLGGPGGMP